MGISQLNELAFWLIDNGANIHMKTYDGLTILFLAARKANCALVERLIREGANVNDINTNNDSVLHFHAQCITFYYGGNKEVLKTLLINGVNFKTDERFQSILKNTPEMRKMFTEVINEIITEYTQKIIEYNDQVRQQLLNIANLPNVLATMAQQYSIPQLSAEQIIDNIMEIRCMLGELSPIQRAMFEQEQAQQNQQAQIAQATPRPVVDPAQQAAAE